MMKRAVKLIFALTSASFIFTGAVKADEALIRFGHYHSFAPVTEGKDQKVKGILVDSLKEIFKHMGNYKAEFYGYPWKRAQDMVKKGDLEAFATTETDARKEYVVFGKEIVFKSKQVAFYSAQNSKAKDIENISAKSDLNNFNIADYLGNGWGKKHLGEFKVYEVNNLDKVLKIVESGRQDIHIGAYSTVKYKANKLGVKLKAKEVPFFGGMKFKVGVRKSHPKAQEIVDKIDEVVRKLRAEGKFEQIKAAHLN